MVVPWMVAMPFMLFGVFLQTTGAFGRLTLTVWTILTPWRARAGKLIWVTIKLGKAILTAKTINLSLVLCLDGLVLVYLLSAYGVKDLFPCHDCRTREEEHGSY
jgi:hypothetical protein